MSTEKSVIPYLGAGWNRPAEEGLSDAQLLQEMMSFAASESSDTTARIQEMIDAGVPEHLIKAAIREAQGVL